MNSYARFASLALTLVLFGSLAPVEGAYPNNMIHGRPAFDSGWRDIGGVPLEVVHNLGGNPDHYVVDVQIKDIFSEAPLGVHRTGFGGDRFGDETTDWQGTELIQMDDTSVWLKINAQTNNADQLRVRIWVVPFPEYDSGWMTYPSNDVLELDHDLGGNPDNYVVDLMMRNGSLVHQRKLGGDYYFETDSTMTGSFWRNLTDSQITVVQAYDRGEDPEVRVRIFVRPTPDYDSGWTNLDIDTFVDLPHNLGGPWNDFYVDMQLKDTSAHPNMGVHNFAINGDDSGTSFRGVSWSGLTAGKVRLNRFVSDIYADEIRIRIWACRAAAFDSGWSAVTPGVNTLFTHNLGGDPDSYVVDMQTRDTDGSVGNNSYGFGGDSAYNFPSEIYQEWGAAWSELDGAGLRVYRWPEDTLADEVRIRIWIAAPPDFDSGWASINQAEMASLNHDLGDYADDLVVDLQTRGLGSTGVNQLNQGGNQYYSTSQTAYVGTGADWRRLTSANINVYRHPNDLYADEFRVRIWKNTAFDASRFEPSPLSSGSVWAHGLDKDPDDTVVYLIAHSDNSNIAYHRRYFGGDTIYYGSPQTFGFWWQELTATNMELRMGAAATSVDHLYADIWWTGPSGLVFSDGFERGTLNAWSVSSP